MLYGVVVSVPSKLELALKVRRVTTPLDADAASVGLVPRLYVVLVDGLVSFTVTEDVGVGVGVGDGIGVGVGVGVGVAVGVGVGVPLGVGVGFGMEDAAPVLQARYFPPER